MGFLVYILIAVREKQTKVNSERIVVADVTDTPFLDYVDAEGIIQHFNNKTNILDRVYK